MQIQIKEAHVYELKQWKWPLSRRKDFENNKVYHFDMDLKQILNLYKQSVSKNFFPNNYFCKSMLIYSNINIYIHLYKYICIYARGIFIGVVHNTMQMCVQLTKYINFY